MDRSKIVVIAILFTIVIGVFAWSWVEIVHSPDYDPEKAHLFLEHFHVRCTAEFDDDFCGDVIGDHHRQCFTDHLEYAETDELEETGPIIYSRSAYLACMESSIEEQLGTSER